MIFNFWIKIEFIFFYIKFIVQFLLMKMYFNISYFIFKLFVVRITSI